MKTIWLENGFLSIHGVPASFCGSANIRRLAKQPEARRNYGARTGLSGQRENSVSDSYPSQPSPLEKNAAAELAGWLTEMSSVSAALPIISEKEYSEPSLPFISIGQTDLLKKASIPDAEKSLTTDGYGIAVKDGNLYLWGGQTRGILNAVFALLEEDMGCRWYSDESIRMSFESSRRKSSTPSEKIPIRKSSAFPRMTAARNASASGAKLLPMRKVLTWRRCSFWSTLLRKPSNKNSPPSPSIPLLMSKPSARPKPFVHGKTSPSVCATIMSAPGKNPLPLPATANSEKSSKTVPQSMTTFPFLTSTFLKDSTALFKQAEVAADSPEVLQRVQRERLPILYVQLTRGPESIGKSYGPLIDKFEAIARRKRVASLKEHYNDLDEQILIWRLQWKIYKEVH